LQRVRHGYRTCIRRKDHERRHHPFYTGTQKSVDNMGGRVERFRNRFGKK
jgi:ribosomal protein L31